MDTSNDSEIAKFYEGQNIFITGGTGFIGKVLIEKLLRSCPLISNIYVLIRTKNKLDTESRYLELINSKVFDKLKKDNENILTKIIPISGDVTKPNLGMDEKVKLKLLENVSIVFHSAATVKFDELLRQAIIMNIKGTKTMIEFAKQMKRLVAFTHVSTAFAFCGEYDVTEEKHYLSPLDSDLLLNLSNCLDDKSFESFAPRILKAYPNSYTFTKAVAENVVFEYGKHLPVIIIRPSIVTGSWKEPEPGWVDSRTGVTGVITGTSKGVIQSIKCDKNMIADIIPVDIAVNLMIAVPWHTSITRPSGITIFNCGSGFSNQYKWNNMKQLIEKYTRMYPPSKVLLHPQLILQSNPWINFINTLVLHKLPAYFADLLCILFRKTPLYIKTQQKMSKALSLIQYFTTHEIKVINVNMIELFKKLNSTDKTIFNFNISNINLDNYMETYCLGVRKHILKEDTNSIVTARKNLKVCNLTVFLTIETEKILKKSYTNIVQCEDVLDWQIN